MTARPGVAGYPVTELSPRELDVVELLAEGRTDLEVAQVLGLSKHTVAAHITAARLRMSALNRPHLIARCYVEAVLDSGQWPPRRASIHTQPKTGQAGVSRSGSATESPGGPSGLAPSFSRGLPRDPYR